MPPRLNCSAARGVSRAIARSTASRHPSELLFRNLGSSRSYATTPVIPLGSFRLPDDYIPPTQPPSARPPEARKSQLLRTYTSLLRSTPLILFFQHNNLTAVEWAAIRRELRDALAKVPPPAASPTGEVQPDISSDISIQVLRSRMLNVAFKVVEFFDAEAAKSQSNAYTHDLSITALETLKTAEIPETSTYAQVSPLLVGPIAALTFPAVSPAHLAAALSVLSPVPGKFPAPSRKNSPGYWDPPVQNGLQKLFMIGGRVEGKVFDQDGVRWVGGIQGGLDGLRAQLVGMLQNAGLGLTTALEGHSKGLWLALEGRRTQLEEEANGGKPKEEEQSQS